MRTNQGIITDSTKSRAFTLIEMIGVLAVIAILAALLIPKVFEAIHSARIGNASTSIQTVKTAVVDHYAKFGSLNSSNGVAIGAVTNYDGILLTETFLDKPFETKISTPGATDVNLVALGAAAIGDAVAAGATSGVYNLDGVGANDVAGSYVVQAVMPGVSVADAHELSVRVDGEGALSPAGADGLGRVRFDTAADPTIVYVYITHR
jgi:prepilin-type N-terminal cleavage/methylation domain-containing protein